MALDRVEKSEAEKAEVKDSSAEKPESENKLLAEAQILSGSQESKPGPALTAAKADGASVEAAAGPSRLELQVNLQSLQNAALKAEIKNRQPGQNPAIPKYDGSVLDTVSSVLKKTASFLSSNSTVNTVIETLSSPLAGLSAGIGAGISLGSKLVRVAEGMYQSEDKKVTVSRVRGEEAAKLADDWDRMFDSDKPCTGKDVCSIEVPNIYDSLKTQPSTERVSSVDDTSALSQDLKRWLFDENEKAKGSDNLFSYKDQKGQRTEITAVPGHVHLETRDENGNLKTIVDKSNNQSKNKTMVLHEKESVVIEGDKQVVKGDGYKVSWDDQGKRHIFLDNGNEVVRDGDSVKIIDQSGSNTLEVQKGSLVNPGSGWAFSDSLSSDDLAKRTEEIRKGLEPGQAYLLAIKGRGTRAILNDDEHTTFDVNGNKARLEYYNKDNNKHQVIHLEKRDDQIFVKKDGNWIPADSKDSPIKVEDGKFKLGDLVIETNFCPGKNGENQDGGIRHFGGGRGADNKPADGGALRPGSPWGGFVMHKLNNAGQEITATTDGQGNSKFIEANNTYENNSDNKEVKITTIDPAANDSKKPGDSNEPAKTVDVMTVDLGTTKIDTPKLVDDTERTVIKDTNTVIEKDRTVKFEDGPIVNPDGSVKVDKHTFIDKDMHVTSHGWESSAASGGRNSISELNAQSIAVNVAGKAQGMQNLVKGSNVSWAEIASLNSALCDVVNLLSSVPVGSPAHAMLLRSYALLVDAINIATPKAQAADCAEKNGLKSEEDTRAVEKGANPDLLKRNRSAA